MVPELSVWWEPNLHTSQRSHVVYICAVYIQTRGSRTHTGIQKDHERADLSAEAINLTTFKTLPVKFNVLQRLTHMHAEVLSHNAAPELLFSSKPVC